MSRAGRQSAATANTNQPKKNELLFISLCGPSLFMTDRGVLGFSGIAKIQGVKTPFQGGKAGNASTMGGSVRRSGRNLREGGWELSN
jgi:hypothetical protein